jgi:hypothetical protein
MKKPVRLPNFVNSDVAIKKLSYARNDKQTIFFTNSSHAPAVKYGREIVFTYTLA